MPVELKTFSVFLVCLVSLAFAPARPDFSGSYAEQGKATNEAGSPAVVLRVVQTDTFVEVTQIQRDGPLTNRFPLDGHEGDYITPTGVHGKSKAHFSKETLVLDTSVASNGNDGRSRRFETREEWRLSKDLKTLTIKTEIRVPDMPPEMAAMAFPNNPQTTTYQRAAAR
jgi:hypothetical protein